MNCQNTLLIITKGVLKSTRISTFSNLPYSAFKTNTLLDANLSKTKAKFSKFKFRKTIVSLRAPKHFKVGRQHYSIGNRFGYFFLKNKNKTFIDFKHKTDLAAVASIIFNKPNIQIRQPLTTLKTVELVVSLKFNFKPLI